MMVDPDKYIKEGLTIVDNLLAQNNLAGALKACQELLRVNPYHRKLQRYIEKIQEKIIKENIEKVDRDIAATIHLWEQHRYDELAKIYAKLYQYAPNHTRLRKLIEKLNAQMSTEQQRKRTDFINRALVAINELLRTERFSEAIQASNELLMIDPLNTTAKQSLEKIKDAYIEAALQRNRNTVEGADFARALAFYESLLPINPEHKRLKMLILKTKSHIAEQNHLAAKIHLNESVARMKELFGNKEYEKVIQACEEIDRLEAGNFTAQIFKKKAIATMRHESEVLELQQLKRLQTTFAAEYAAHPEKFIKV